MKYPMFGRMALSRMIAAIVALICPLLVAAHEVPNAVTVLAYIKPDGQALTILLRAPMASLRDVDVPLDEQGFLDLSRVDTALQHASQLWIRDFLQVYENGRLLPSPELVAARVSLPSDDSFERSYEDAFGHTTGGKLAADTQMHWEQGLLDVAYEFPISSESSSFSINPGLKRLGIEVNVLMRYLGPDGAERVYDVHADVGRINLEPSLWQAISHSATEGFRSVLQKSNYLLFLLALAIPFAGLRPLLALGGAYFAGQSITLMATANGLAPNTLWLPYLVQMAIAASILYLAIENIVGTTLNRRWRLAVLFGLIYGFALWVPLSETLQFSGSHVAASVLAFDLGAGLAALVALAVAMLAATLLFKYVIPMRIGTIILSAFIAHAAWHWTTERAALLGQFPLPDRNALVASGTLSWVTALVALATVLWLSSGLGSKPKAEQDATAAREG